MPLVRAAARGESPERVSPMRSAELWAVSRHKALERKILYRQDFSLLKPEYYDKSFSGVVTFMTFRKRLMVTFATVIVVPMLLFTLSFIALGNYLIGEKGELRGYTSIVGNYDTFDLDAVQAFQKAEQNPDKLQDVDFLDSLASDLRDRNVYLVVRRDEGLYYASNETMAVDDLSYLPEDPQILRPLFPHHKCGRRLCICTSFFNSFLQNYQNSA